LRADPSLLCEQTLKRLLLPLVEVALEP